MAAQAARTGAAILRRATPEDTDGICALLGAAFPDNPKRHPAVYRWQYWDNPFGPPSVWLWEAGGAVVCHGATFATPGVLDGRPVRLGHAADSATATSHRKAGLYARLARARYRDSAHLGMAAVLSLPNTNSLPGAVGAGLRPVARVTAWVLPLDDAWLAARLRLPGPVAVAARAVAARRRRGARGQETAGPPAGLDGLWQRSARCWPNGVARHAGWWRWRYADRPGGRYRYFQARSPGGLRAAAATTVRDDYGGRFLHLLELLADDAPAARCVVAAAVDAAPDAVAATVVAQPGSRLAGLAAACGFLRLPRRLEPRPMTLGIVAGSHDVAALARRRWSLSWGDHDHL